MIIGASSAMAQLDCMVRKVAPTDATVLLTGESGVGKELVARVLHEHSGRAGGELVAVNCGAIPRELIESELFGHTRGSFTGATANHRGLFEQAAGGTLFLDEITEMDFSLQSKLLRVLETDRVRPVGGEREAAVNCRIIAATNRDPEVAVRAGRLREDLFYRLAQFPIRIPPLRERGEDIRLLAEHFLSALNERSGTHKRFSGPALDALARHDWPGNVRELRNAVVHGHLLADGCIEPEDLPGAMACRSPGNGEVLQVGVGMSLAEVERRHILATLEHFGGNKTRAASALGIALRTLYNRLDRYGAL